MILHQDPESGFWVLLGKNLYLSTHGADGCLGEWCDVHNKRHPSDADYPLNWREDRGIIEFICDHGVGHPTYAQREYNRAQYKEHAVYYNTHGCDGCCSVDDV